MAGSTRWTTTDWSLPTLSPSTYMGMKDSCIVTGLGLCSRLSAHASIWAFMAAALRIPQSTPRPTTTTTGAPTVITILRTVDIVSSPDARDSYLAPYGDWRNAVSGGGASMEWPEPSAGLQLSDRWGGTAPSGLLPIPGLATEPATLFPSLAGPANEPSIRT